MQRERRRDPFPWTWELPVLALLGTLLVALVGVHIGRGLANFLTGPGWTWPETSTTGAGLPSPLAGAFWQSLPAVLAGDAAAGLPAPPPDGVAGAATLWGCILVVEAALLAAATWGSLLTYRSGPGRMRGMATTSEAEQLLGTARLRKVAPFVRPDLHGRNPSPSVHREAGTDQDTNIEIGGGLSSPWLPEGRRHTTRGSQ